MNLFGEEEAPKVEKISLVNNGKFKGPLLTYFNRIKRIEKLQKEIEEIPKRILIVSEIYENEIVPQLNLNNESLKKIIIGINEIVEKYTFSKGQKTILQNTICELIESIFDEKDSEINSKINSIYAKFNNGQTISDHFKEEETQDFINLKNLCEEFEIEIPGSKTEFDKLTPEELNELKFIIGKKMDEYREQQNQEFFKSIYGERAFKPRKKTKAQLEKEKKEAEKEELKKKSLRDVYLGLAKFLHPDKETDEQLKIEKEETMKLATAAYQNNNLMELLKLEIQFLNKNQADVEQMADEKIRLYNEILKEQEELLFEKRINMLRNPATAHINDYLIDYPRPVPYAINQAVLKIKNKSKSLTLWANEFSEKPNKQQVLWLFESGFDELGIEINQNRLFF